MAYNGGFPISYQSYYPQYGIQNQQVQQQSNSIIWVQGEAGAKSYLVAPGNTVQLWDSEAQTIYLKSADASGIPSMRILDYTIRSNTPNVLQNITNSQNGESATREDINSLQAQIDAIKQEINKIGGRHEPTLQSDATRSPEQQSNKPVPAI